MPINLSTQQGLSPKEAAKYLPSYRDGKPCHPSKVVRQILKGTRLPDGSIARLEALRLGNQWVTTLEAIREHGERVAAARIGRSIDTPAPSTSARRKEHERTARALDAAGIK